MMHKIDYKKDYKDIYLPKQKPTLINLNPMKYITVGYLGDPNEDKFQYVMSALYSLSYSIKMKSKKREDYYEYVIFPLEGIWDLQDYTVSNKDKSNFKATMMIRQPDFLNEELFEEYRTILLNKETDENIIEKLKEAKLEIIDEGLNLQMLHVGSYDDESKTFDIMEAYLEENNYLRKSKTHKEIYLSDPRKTAEDKLRTVLRIKIEDKEK